MQPGQCPTAAGRREGGGLQGLTCRAEGCCGWWGGTRFCFLSSAPTPRRQTPEGQVLLPGQPRMGTRTKEALFVEQVEEWQGEQQLGRKGHRAAPRSGGSGAPKTSLRDLRLMSACWIQELCDLRQVS